MALVIAAYDKDGKCLKRCDARCYDAQHDDCECICGGHNHGKGHRKALANSTKYGEDWIFAYQGETSEAVEFLVRMSKPIPF